MMTTHSLPPGSLGHPHLGEMADFVCDPIAFVWERYRKYGRIFKTRLVRQPRIFLIGPEANKLVLYDRADWFSVGAPIRHTRGAFYSDEALTLNDGESFRRLKSAIAPTLNPTILVEFLPALRQLVDRSLVTWANQETVLFWYEMAEFMHEVNAQWLTGAPITNEEQKLLHDLFDVPEGRYLEGWPPKRDRSEILREYKHKSAARDALHCHLQELIRDRRQNPRQDAISTLMATIDSKTNTKLSDRELIENIVQLLIGGYDTTASVASWLFYRLAKHPDIRERLRQEIEQVVGEEEFEYAHFKEMPYLRSVLKEVVRMHPPGLGSLRMALKPFEFDGYSIPTGWQVQLSTYVTHFMPEIFSEPERFEPERFLPPREEDKKDSFALIGFGGGLRQCPGKQFALLILATLAVSAIKNYHWSIESERDPTPVFDPMLKPKDRLPLRFSRRTPQFN